MVFVIASGSPEFKGDVTAIMDTLEGFGLKGYFALLSEEEKGLDAFCDKICSRIISCQFCVAVFNDPVVDRLIEGATDRFVKVRVPSANVYYEFGMAVALGKNVIPIIHSGFRLPFDVQHLDAIEYDDVNDLKRKLKSPILATLKKKAKKPTLANTELVKLVYGPLYNEIDRFLSRRDKFTRFEPNQYSMILVNSKYLLDTIDVGIRGDIEAFYSGLEEFNNIIVEAEGIIRRIVIKEISDFEGAPPSNLRTISVGLETETGQILPTLDQILMRKTTPERYLQATGTSRTVKRITYKLRMPDHSEREIDSNLFGLLYRKCGEKVENDPRIARMRELATDLELKGKELKEKFRQHFR